LRIVPLSAAVLLALVAAGAPAAAQDAQDTPPTIRDVIERWSRDARDLASFYDVPLSEIRERRLAELEREVGAEAATTPLDENATLPDRIDATLLTDRLAFDAQQRAWDRSQDARAAPLLPFASAIVGLEEARRALEPVAPRDAADVLVAARKQLDAVRERLGKPADDPEALTVEPPVALRAARSIEALKRALGDWFRYRDGYEPEFGWWVRTPYHALDGKLGEYAKWLREERGLQKGDDPPLVGEPSGAEGLAAALRHERIVYSPEELIAIAEQHLAWCDEEDRKASEEMGLGGDWHAAVEAVKASAVDPGKMDDLVASLGREAIDFVTERELVHVPDLCRELWRLEMISADAQKTLPFAAYSGNRMLVAYATESMGQEAKLMSLRGNNARFSRIVVPHELVPGHHLQLFYADRYATYRAPFGTPFLVEGWALYWEMRLWEQGWARGPEDRIGMLFWRKHRCARVIVTMRYHLGEMTTQEMIDFLVDRVGLERDGATAEVRRYVGGGYGPLYQAAYLTGGLQLRALHREAVESGKMTEIEFHERVLEQNSIPVDLIRDAVLGLPPTPEPRWRFAD